MKVRAILWKVSRFRWNHLSNGRNWPNDLKIKELEKRLQTKNVKELILALPATMEGDTTNFYLFRRLKDFDIKFTVISRGIGIGNQLEYIDEITLGKSLLDRTEYKSNYQ